MRRHDSLREKLVPIEFGVFEEAGSGELRDQLLERHRVRRRREWFLKTVGCLSILALPICGIVLFASNAAARNTGAAAVPASSVQADERVESPRRAADPRRIY